MGHNAGDRQVQSHGDVHEWLAIQENCLNKFIHQMAMRTAMTASGPTGRQRWAMDGRKSLFQSLVFVVEGPLLSSYAAHLTPVTWSVPAHTHPRHPAFGGSEQGDFGPKGISVAVVRRLQMLDPAGHAEARDFNEATASHANIICVGVGGITLRWQANAPFLMRRQRVLHVVKIFALRVHQLAK